MAKAPPLSAFYSYSQKDEKLRAQLDAGLAALKQDGWIKTWYDQEIRPGDDWEGEIQKQLHQADIILALNSNNFNGSKYCMKEVQVALERHQRGEARLIPIILTPSMMIKALSDLQALPRGLKPLSSGTKVNLKLLLEVSQRIQEDIGKICANGGGQGSGERAPAVLDASQTILAQLCNRVEQDSQLRKAWDEHFDSFERRRRPFVCLVHGNVEEDHNGYLKRLARYSLPQALNLGADSEIRNPLKVNWPDYSTVQTQSSSAMLGAVAVALNCAPTFAAVAPKLYQLGQASVVYCELPSNTPGYSDRAALKSFFDFWVEWPDLPIRQKLVVILSVQYRGESVGFPKVEADIVVDSAKDGKISAVILKELPPVSSQQVKEWIRRPEVENFCDVVTNAAVWEREIDAIFRTQPQIPMEQLIGPLNRMLNEYKRRAL